MKKVLVPHEIAEKCTLLEALYWAAFKIYPLVEYGDNGIDTRIDPEYNDDYDLREYITPEDYFDREFCKRYGLPSSPAHEFFLNHGEPTFYSSLTLETIHSFRKSLPEKEYKEILQDYEDAQELDVQQKVFDEALEDSLEISKSELFVALRKERIKCYGRKYHEEDWPEHEQLSCKNWRASSVAWNLTGSFQEDACTKITGPLQRFLP